jgi:hypothetical protein
VISTLLPVGPTTYLQHGQVLCLSITASDAALKSKVMKLVISNAHSAKAAIQSSITVIVVSTTIWLWAVVDLIGTRNRNGRQSMTTTDNEIGTQLVRAGRALGYGDALRELTVLVEYNPGLRAHEILAELKLMHTKYIREAGHGPGTATM